MDAEGQDPIAAIEHALTALRHARPRRGGPHGGPPWMRDESRGAAAADRPAHLEHMPMLRGHRGAGDHTLGGAARFRLLNALRERDGQSISEIAESIGVDQPRASRLVNDSAERGLVTRRADDRDARRSVVELTDAGRAMLDKANASRRSAVTDALSGFTAEETATLASLLTRFVEGFRRN